MEDKADKGERELWKMKQGFSLRCGDALYQAKERVRTGSISAPPFDSLDLLCVTEPFSLLKGNHPLGLVAWSQSGYNPAPLRRGAQGTVSNF